MIIRFIVKNFRSIKEEQTLSMVRDLEDETLPDNFFKTSALENHELLKSVALYGANASGKSNVIKALGSMSFIIRNLFKKSPDESIQTESFLFDIVSNNSPTFYEISAVVTLDNLQETRVDYGFIADEIMIHEEWLNVYPSGKEHELFSRKFDYEKDKYVWQISDYLDGEKESWKNQTRKDQLFLSTSVQLNSQQLKPIYDLFSKKYQLFLTIGLLIGLID